MATGERGVTLAELLLAMAISGLVLLVSWPAIEGEARRVRGRSAADAAAVSLEAARQRAVESGHVQRIDVAGADNVPRSVSFYPDGSADRTMIPFGGDAALRVDETGRISADETR